MTARPRKSAPRKPAPVEDGEEYTVIDAIGAEVDVEEEDDEGAVVIPLVTKNGTAMVRIPSPVDWSARATDLLADGRLHSWAQLTLSDADWDRWLELDATNTEGNEFMRTWREASGQDEGKSRAVRRSSKRMRRK